MSEKVQFPEAVSGTVRQRTAMLCVSRTAVLCVELRDPTTRKRFWSLPGGAIESGETALQAAERETSEETGYSVKADPTSEVITHYPFRWNARLVQCETHWFVGELENEQQVQVDDADFLLGCAWIPIPKLAGLLSPHPHIQQTVLGLLGARGPFASQKPA